MTFRIYEEIKKANACPKLMMAVTVAVALLENADRMKSAQ